ncbi:MAG: ArsR family transcriptional regulator [Humibacillus sp.]|nr:ArsR family transcriptional regulator [Humibacillus sp.]
MTSIRAHGMRDCEQPCASVTVMLLDVRHHRHLEIVQRLKVHGVTSVEDLARSFGVSTSTIRRDLQLLDASGQLVRVNGGAVSPADDADVTRPFATVAAAHVESKRAVARRAAALVDDGATVLLDIGTTTHLLALELRGRPLTVVTASLAVLDALRDDGVVELVLLGGFVRRTYHSMVGVLTEDALRQVHADIAFLGASGVRGDGTVLDTTLVEVPVKRALLGAADRAVLLTDLHKFPGTGTLRVCGPEKLSAVVTNDGADPETLAVFGDRDVEVVLA